MAFPESRELHSEPEPWQNALRLLVAESDNSLFQDPEFDVRATDMLKEFEATLIPSEPILCKIENFPWVFAGHVPPEALRGYEDTDSNGVPGKINFSIEDAHIAELHYSLEGSHVTIPEYKRKDQVSINLLDSGGVPLQSLEAGIRETAVGTEAIEELLTDLSPAVQFASLIALKGANTDVSFSLSEAATKEAEASLQHHVARSAVFHNSQSANRHAVKDLVAANAVLGLDAEGLESGARKYFIGERNYGNFYEPDSLVAAGIDGALGWIIGKVATSNPE